MNDQERAIDLKLDSLTRSVRFAAGIAPKCATRVSLGVALAMEDAATDPAGELLGIKFHQGASALANGIGSIASSVSDGVRSGAKRLGSQDAPFSNLPVLEKARGFAAQAMNEVRESWDSAGHIAVEIEQPHVQQAVATPV